MGRFDFPSPYWDSVGDPALDLIERMLEVNPDRRITVDGALNHPWITEGHIEPGESCASLADAIENLGFVRRKAVHERTLLAEAPGHANPASQNPSKVKVQIHQQNNGGSSTKGNVGNLIKKAGNSLDPQTKAFIHIGGKGGDETLYASSAGESSYVEVETPEDDEHESTT
jgi:serine/threonine-protein kinase Chk2